MPELLRIYINTLDDGAFQFLKTELIQKLLEAKGLEHCNGLPTPTKVEESLGAD